MPGNNIKYHPSTKLRTKIFAISFLIFNILVLSSLIFAPQVKAAVSSCSASVSPTSVTISTSPNLTFTVNNTSSQTIVWVKFTSPSSNFTVTSGSASGWSSSTTSSTATFTSGSITANGSGTLTVATTVGSSTGSESWTVQVSDSSDGASPTTCSGSASVTVSSTDQTAPTLSGLTVSDISDTSVKISWTTDENTTSTLNYGKTISYGSSTTTSSATSHAVTLTGLSANTTYHFNIIYKDTAGNEEETGDNTFTTAKEGTKTVTKTETKTVTPTPTPTPAPDRTAPYVVVNTDLEVPYEKAPEISGSASDARSSIAKIEYSTDDGRTWSEEYSADITVKSLPLSVSFKFTPSISEDGNYKLKVRATDSSNNTGLSKTQTLIIDRLPPLLGGNIVSFGPQIIYPGAHGAMVTIAGFDQKITLSSVGGATTIDLLVDSANPSTLLRPIRQAQGRQAQDRSGQVFSLVKDLDSSLWYGTMNFSLAGVYSLKSRAVDGTNKVTKRILNPIIALPKGKVISHPFGKLRIDPERSRTGQKSDVVSGAKITLFHQEPRSKFWMVWDAKPFGQENPQLTNSNGEYVLFVPSGVYYLTIQAKGFSKLTSPVFSIKTPTPINSVFKLKLAKTLRLGPLSISIPDFSTSNVSINLIAPSLDNIDYDNKLLDKEAPRFKLPLTDGKEFDLIKLRGRPSIVTFVSTWAPPAVEQLSVLDRLIKGESIRGVVVSTQESFFQLRLFQRRGEYSLPIVIDQDGTLVEQYNLTSLPTHYFLDRRGVVRKVVSGVLNEKEIKEEVAQTRQF